MGESERGNREREINSEKEIWKKKQRQEENVTGAAVTKRNRYKGERQRERESWRQIQS